MVERLALDQDAWGFESSLPSQKRPVRSAVRTPASHAGNRGSIPLRATIFRFSECKHQADTAFISGRNDLPDFILDTLNPAQQRAVTYLDGPALVIAGAGSGKTRVIAHRIAYLLTTEHVSPRSILAVTFTNKAANEMKSRVMTLLKKDALPFLWMGTFHSICARILRADVEKLHDSYTRDFTIIDTADAAGVMKLILRDRGISEKNFQPKSVLSAISKAKLSGIRAGDFAAGKGSYFTKTVAPVYSDYERRLASSNLMDFDDLLVLAVRLLEESEEVRERYQDRFRHVLVDEYQDTSRIQYRLLRFLAGSRGELFAVGDEDQSIYRWRGADIRNILDFQRDFPEAAVIRLERNYRSTKAVLAAANALIAHNTQRLGKTLWTEKSGGDAVKSFAAPTDREEAAFVTDTMKKLHGLYQWRQMAVLYRTNAQSRTFEEACLNRNILYQIVGGQRFYERKEVKDVMAYLRLAINPLDRVALLRVLNVPPRGIGKVTIERLEKKAVGNGTSLLTAVRAAVKEDSFPTKTLTALKGFLEIVDGTSKRLPNASPAELAEWVLQATAYFTYLATQSRSGPDPEARNENLRELISAMREFEGVEGGDLRAFLERQALYSDQDELGWRAPDSVRLMTLHAAKGLEFPVVFLVGLEEDLFPHSFSAQTEDGIQEERRLCYVGMTRAMELLHLSWARRRYVYGVPRERRPSTFLSEIPSGLVEEVGGVGLVPSGFEGAAAMLRGAQRQPEPSLLRVGARVRHRKYGFGIVLATEGSGDGLKVIVSFSRFGRKRLLAKMAHLEAF